MRFGESNPQHEDNRPGYGHMAMPGEVGDTASTHDLDAIDIGKFSQYVKAVEDDPNHPDRDRLDILQQRLDNLKSSKGRQGYMQ